MSDPVATNRRPIADNLGLVAVVAAIIASNTWMTNSLGREIESVRGEMNAMRNEMNARFEQMDARIDQMDARIDQVDSRMDRMENRLERIEGHLYDLNGRMARVETGVLGYEPPAPPGTTPGADSPSTPEPQQDLNPVACL